MKKKLRLYLCIGSVLILCIVFASVFISYSKPMKDTIYDLSLRQELTEVLTIDVSGELGWTIYTQEGDVVSPMTADGYGCYEPLPTLGQTFYFSRVMTEQLDAATLQLGTANRNFSVFLDGVLIYTDCPEQDNRIGYLNLPMREFDRKEDVLVSLPEDYVGKTLTIAQSTPLYFDSPRMATRVIPATVQLYCSYAYESKLIAESFQAAFVGATSYVLGVVLLIVFLRQIYLGHFDWGLLFLALTVFLTMTAHMYDTSYSLNYFGIPDLLSIPEQCQNIAVAALLAFLSTKITKLRPLPWIVTGLFVIFFVVLNIVGNAFPATDSLFSQFLWRTYDCLSGYSLLFVFILGCFCRKDSPFFRSFVPMTLASLLLVIVIYLVLPSRADAFAYFVMALKAQAFRPMAYYTALIMMVISIAIIIMQTIRSEINLHTEKQLMLEMSQLAQQRYENLRKRNEEVMAIRHDMSRHFALLRQMTTEERPAQYLDELIGQNKKIRPIIQSGNEMIDIILSGRLSAAIDAGLQVDIARAKAPEKLHLTDADLCSLTMNLIDNAIEAASKSSAAHPWLKLDLHVKNNFFVFICENAASMNDQQTKKTETLPEHGLGLRIVRQIADRYDCLLQTEFSSDQYKVSLAIPLSHPSR